MVFALYWWANSAQGTGSLLFNLAVPCNVTKIQAVRCIRHSPRRVGFQHGDGA